VAWLRRDPAQWREVLRAQLEGALAGGVDVVQIREADLDAGEYADFVRECVTRAAGTSCRIVVNDRLDVAWVAGAQGVHLRERSTPLAEVEQYLPRIAGPSVRGGLPTRAWHFPHTDRGIRGGRGVSTLDAQFAPTAREFCIGRSVHDASTAVTSRTADYLVAGSIFETASKPGRVATLGLEGLRQVVEAVGECPVWAIGGITPERIPEVRACGVLGVAAIGAFFPRPEAADVRREVQKVTETLRFSLDRYR
jgi:thiamine-phosphate pyrophosphorylase